MSEPGKPDRTGRTAEQIDRARTTYESQLPTYVAFAEALRVLLTQLSKNAEIAISSIEVRAKEASSLSEKIRRRGYEHLDEVIDKCGARMITRYQSDVELVSQLLRREFDVIEETQHGAQSLESFGYTSKHLVLRLGGSRADLLEWQEFQGLVAEVQVRSILQHAWATISHSLDYKAESEVPRDVRRRLFRVAALLETGDEIFDTFRSEVADLRAGYAQRVFEEDWRGLPVDLDSLDTALPKFVNDRVESLAVEVGWRQGRKPSDAWRAMSTRALVEVGVEAGLQTIGEIAHYFEDVDRYADALRDICELATRNGFTPHANGIDPVALVIVREHKERFSEDVPHYRKQLWWAALGLERRVEEVPT